MGKSTVVAAMAAHVAQGRNFAGLQVQNAVVIYYAAEDAHGVKLRSHGYMREPAWKNAPYYICETVPDLLDPRTFDEVTGFAKLKMREHGRDQCLIVFDTLNRCIGDADENSASEMGAVVGSASKIAKAVNAAVLLVHHVGNANGDRPRGSSAFHGNVDFLALLKKASGFDGDKVVNVSPLKQKNAKEIGSVTFRLDSLHIGIDNDGDKYTVPVAIPLEPGVTAKPIAAANTNRKPTATKSSARKDDLLQTLNDLEQSNPGVFHSAQSVAARSGSAFNDVRNNADSLRVAVRRTLAILVSEQALESNSEGYRVALIDQVNDNGDLI